MPSPRRRFSDTERAAAIAALTANNGNVARTARELNIPESTIRGWASGEYHPEARVDAEKVHGPLADEFEGLAWTLLGVARDKAGSMTAKDAMIAAGIATDKMQLLRNAPTSINLAHVVACSPPGAATTPIARMAELEAAFEAAAAREHGSDGTNSGFASDGGIDRDGGDLEQSEMAPAYDQATEDSAETGAQKELIDPFAYD